MAKAIQIRYKQWLQERMEKDKKMGRAYFNPQHRRYERRPGIPLKGIHKLLKKWYYPDYKMPQHRSDRSLAPGRSSGRKRGAQVDLELTLWAEGELKRGKMIHTFTQRAISVLQQEGYSPLRGQVVVYDEASRIGTAIDLVVVHKQRKEVVPIELKCGMQNYWAKKGGQLAHPLQKYTSCPRSHAFLQLQTSVVLAERCGLFKTLVSKGYAVVPLVMKVDAHDTRLFTLPKWVTTKAKSDIITHIDDNNIATEVKVPSSDKPMYLLRAEDRVRKRIRDYHDAEEQAEEIMEKAKERVFNLLKRKREQLKAARKHLRQCTSKRRKFN